MTPSMLSMLSLLFLLILELTIRTSSNAQNPQGSEILSGNPREKSQQIDKKPTIPKKPPKQDERGTEKMPLVIRGIPAEKTPQQADEDKRELEIKRELDRELTKYTGYQAKFTFILIFVGILQLGLFGWQLWMIRRSLADTKTAAEAAKLNAFAALEQATAIKLSERAYVKISHGQPGLIMTNPINPPLINMEVKNIGNTPARITGLILWRIILEEAEPLPNIPPYPNPERDEEMFLYKDDPFYFTRRFAIDSSEIEAIQDERKIFYVFGYVDYIDQFGQRHRAGYARRFEPREPTNNLAFVTQEGYNYDRHRLHDEGRDW